MLYELATGQNPFRRDDAVAVIKAQMTLEPPRAHDRDPDISPFFSEVCATLMAKSPAARFGSADELRTVLTEGEKSEWWAGREKMLRTIVAELPPIEVRRETTLHGRETELAALDEAWTRAKEGDGNVLLIEGEAGLGKTRLIDSFLRKLKTEAAHVLYGSYPPSGGLGGISDAILSKFGSSGLAENLAPYMTVTPTLIPAFAALIRHETAPTGSEPLRGDALSAVLCHIMRALAEEKPTIWVIEDLHFAAGDARNAVLSMARALHPHRVLLVLSARQLAEEDHVHLSRLDYYKRLPLGRLGARDVIELLRDAFQSEALAEKLGGKIAYKSDGVPFFVFEMIRGLREGRFLKQNPDGTYVQTQMITDIEVPSAVKDLIETRLSGLDKSERAILEVGAVQGYEFDPGLVARVLEKKKVGVLQDLAEIERRSGIVQGKAGACRFDQYQIQEVLYKDLMPDLRAEYHTLLADAFADREEFDEPEEAELDDAYFLARHYLRGSKPKRAMPYLDAAMTYLTGAFQNDAAVDLAQRALGAKRMLKGGDRVAMLRRLAGRLDVRGRREEQWAAIEEALALTEAAENVALRVGVLSEACTYCDRIARYDRSLSYAQEAIALVEDLADPTLRMTALTVMSTALRRLGRAEESLKIREELLELARGRDSKRHEWIAIGNLGVAYWSLGRYAERKRCHELRMESASDSGTTGAVAHLNLANVHSDLGDLSRARELQAEALRLSREVGFRALEAHSLFETGKIEERAGDPDLAVDAYRAAASLSDEIGDIQCKVECLTALGRVRAKAGDSKAALTMLGEAVQVAAEKNLQGAHQLAAAWVANVSGANDGTAIRVLAENDAHIPHHEKLEGRFVLWQATGDPEHLTEAHRLLSELREHAPAEYRQSMIEDIPLNREIMEAWEEQQA
ncbi:MAG: ATP-binding protein [Planctomycetota bacterium]|jgi:tetratricopeptide (TPR) repeat protein